MAKKKTKKNENKKDDLKTKLDSVCKAVSQACPSEWSGDDPVMILKGDRISKIPTFSTGSLELDKNMGGGFAWGRIAEIYGPESSGKSTLMLHTIANVQKEDRLCALIDSENSFDPIYAQSLGVNLDSLLVSQPDHGEHALNVMIELIKNGVGLVVVDSVAALTPREIFEGDVGKATIGVHARMMSSSLRTLNNHLMKKRASVVFTNQIRTRIGVNNASMASSTTGGNALRFYASQRVELKRIGSDKNGEELINNIVKAKVAKNKIAPPFKTCTFKIRFGKGVDMIDQILDIGIDMELIEKGGAWFTINGEKFQGRESAYAALEENEKIREEIFEEILLKMNAAPTKEKEEEKEVNVSVVKEKSEEEEVNTEEIE